MCFCKKPKLIKIGMFVGTISRINNFEDNGGNVMRDA